MRVGFAEDAVCPDCRTYTTQEILSRGVRRCLGCRTEFKLKDVQTVRKVRRAVLARRQAAKLSGAGT